MFVRLNKYLAHAGLASRREADRWIEEGRVFVNGKKITELGTRVDPEKDKVTVKEAQVREEKKVYIALNKPEGFTSSNKRTQYDPKIVLDLVKVPERIYPLGRLDKDTTGLLLLTNDGTLTHGLLHPSAGSEKEYEVTFHRPISPQAIMRLKSGVPLWGEKTMPTVVNKIRPDMIRIILKEGKNRQVRRICEKVGYPVKALKRVRIKNIMLGFLPLGKWRYLTAEEVRGLKKAFSVEL